MVWRVKDWQLDEDSIRIYDFIDDDRWEGIYFILNYITLINSIIKLS